MTTSDFSAYLQSLITDPRFTVTPGHGDDFSVHYEADPAEPAQVPPLPTDFTVSIS